MLQGLKPEELVSLLDYHRRQSTNEAIKTSLQSVIDFVGGGTARQPPLPPSTRRKETPRRQSTSPDENLQVKRSPTEDDLETGCFTDVSFAGTFAAQAQPEESGQLDTDGGCFTEVSFAGTFARPSCEPTRRLEDSTAVTVSKVVVNKAAAMSSAAKTARLPAFVVSQLEHCSAESQVGMQDASLTAREGGPAAILNSPVEAIAKDRQKAFNDTLLDKTLCISSEEKEKNLAHEKNHRKGTSNHPRLNCKKRINAWLKSLALFTTK